jgi:hypothetical protein
MVRAHILPVLLATLLLGCASANPSGVPGETRRSQVIMQEEIRASGMTGNAYEVISRLRPNFLVSRGPTSLGNAQNTSMYANVYVDGAEFGDINSLRNIDSGQIFEIRLYSSGEAQTKFGLGNSNGVIAITTKR